MCLQARESYGGGVSCQPHVRGRLLPPERNSHREASLQFDSTVLAMRGVLINDLSRGAIVRARHLKRLPEFSHDFIRCLTDDFRGGVGVAPLLRVGLVTANRVADPEDA